MSGFRRGVSLDPVDWEAYRQLAHRVVNCSLDYLRDVRQRPTWLPVPAGVRAQLEAPLPLEPDGAERAFADAIRLVMPFATGNIHPRFWGWVHGSGTMGGALAQLLAAAMNSNVGGRNHGAVYVERQVLQWCRGLFAYPDDSSGILLSGTSMATLVALAVARNSGSELDVSNEGLSGAQAMVFFASTEAHASVQKALELLGLGRRALHLIGVDQDFRMDLAELRQAIDRERRAARRPVCVIATAGTVNTGAIDDLNAIASICKAEGLWLHVDGAFGALLTLVPQLASRLRGIEQADSIAFDFHKWLHVPYDAGCVLIRSREKHMAAFSSRPDYLQSSPSGLAGGDPWFCDFGPELSRGFRALPVWLTIKEHGARRLGEKILENCEQAAYLATRIAEHAELELCATVTINIVCFRFLGQHSVAPDLDGVNERIVAALQDGGDVVPSATKLRGRTVIRVAITNHRSRLADFDRLIEQVLACGARVLETCS